MKIYLWGHYLKISLFLFFLSSCNIKQKQLNNESERWYKYQQCHDNWYNIVLNETKQMKVLYHQLKDDKGRVQYCNLIIGSIGKDTFGVYEYFLETQLFENDIIYIEPILDSLLIDENLYYKPLSYRYKEEHKYNLHYCWTDKYFIARVIEKK